jgi:methyl-accepting chemotaxis protein
VSKDEIASLSTQVSDLTAKLDKIADNIIDITGDKDFAKNVNGTLSNVNKLTGNINKILEDPETAQLMSDIKTTMKNVSELSDCINKMSKDPIIRAEVAKTVKNLNEALCKLTVTLDTINYVTEDQRVEIKQSLKDIEGSTANIKKFSEKLNKRFLLFRLIF